MDIKLKKVSPTSTSILSLSDLLHKELEKFYGEGMIEDFGEENEQMLFFFVAYVDSENPIACGALKHFEAETAEIKRMYVKPEYRGMGISKKILLEIENQAKELNYKRLVLETGLKQPEAMGLYQKSGYKPISCYGRHADDSESRCFEKIF